MFWIVVILWYEIGVFLHAVRSCEWPDSRFSGQSLRLPAPSHILLVADPQILDHRSYPERGPLLTYLTNLLVDLNLRKNWRAALRKKPDAVIFLGDMMDGGRFAMSEDEYEQYYHRFTTMFYLPPAVPTYFIPGNHDIGLWRSETFSPVAKLRYMTHFGPLNRLISIANHTIVLLDAPSLVEEDIKRLDNGQTFSHWKPVRGGPVEFVKTVAEARSTGPIVLLSHIPLARDNLDCGPLREKGTIRPGIGLGYQNTLGTEVTAFLLESLKPAVVFSGDDHDYCESNHPSVAHEDSATIREVTVKSLSMAMGIRQPGFQLLSLAPHQYWQTTKSTATYADAPCLLPNQLRIYLSMYVPFFVITLLAIFLSNIPRVALRSSLRQHTKRLSSPQKSAPRPRSRTYNDNQMTSDEDSNSPFRLPFPASASPQISRIGRNMPFSWVLRDRLRRMAITTQVGSIFSDPFLYRKGGNRGLRKRKDKSFVARCIYDVRDIALFPLILFMLISLWILFS